MFRLNVEWSSLGNENSHARPSSIDTIAISPKEVEEWAGVDLVEEVELNSLGRL
jgi:hypothetical protein